MKLQKGTGLANGKIILADEISPEEACMLSDMVPTGFHGVELADVQFGDTVLVVGIGPVGLMAVAGANLRGASRIIAVGTRPVCREAAKKYGATDFIGYKEGPIDEQVLKLTNGAGVDKAIIAGGTVRAIMEAAGVADVLSKSLGSSSAVNVVKATFKATSLLMDGKRVAKGRGKPIMEIWG